MDEDEIVFLALLVDEDAFFDEEPPEKKKRKSPDVWERPWLARRRLPQCENVFTLMNLLREANDTKEFRRMMRMDAETYDYMLGLVANDIRKMDTQMREAIPVEARLAVTMRYLAQGHNIPALCHQFTVSDTSIKRILDETIPALVRALGPLYMQMPHTEAGWKDQASVFQARWQFPNCIGALDGKHVRIKRPNKSGSLFYNYKGYYSIVLMALVSANYEFLYVNAGAEGRQSDGGIWRQCSLRNALMDGTVGLPGPRRLPGANVETEHVIVGDDAFPLGPHLVKPYCRRRLSFPERVFNYRLSRARRISENAFGILATRFGIFKTEIDANPNKVASAVLACCCIHNMLRKRCGRAYIPPSSIDREDADRQLVPGEWRQEAHLDGLQKSKLCNASDFSKEQRRVLQDYFLSTAGEVDWQYKLLAN